MILFETLLILLTICVPLTALAQRFDLPPAAVLVVAGGALAFVPGMPAPKLEPELLLVLFLPPLVQASAYRTDWTVFRANLRPILLLAVGAVLFTAAVVAVVVKLMIPELPWWAAIALGAIVSPPDVVAAKAVLRRLALPKELSTILEGEGVLNDATSLVLYRFAVAAALGASATLGSAAWHFVLAASIGAVVGYAVGRGAMLVFKAIEDNQLDIAVGFLAAYAAYLSAEQLGGSGVLAAVGCGLVLGQRQHQIFTAETRLSAAATWGFVEFVLESLVFILMGLQLRPILDRLAFEGESYLALLAGGVTLAVIGSRFVWMYGAALTTRLRREPRPLPWSHASVLSWAGMRGVVSLAAAIALPADFPERDLIVFLAFCAILATLVVQGTTLGWVIRRLGVALPQSDLPDPALTAARALAAEAAHAAITEVVAARPELQGVADAVERDLAARAQRARAVDDDGERHGETLSLQVRLKLETIAAARTALTANTETLDAEAVRVVREELDLDEQRLRRILDENNN